MAAGKLSLLSVSKVKCLLELSLGLQTAVWPNTPLSKLGTGTGEDGILCVPGLSWATPTDRASEGVYGGVPGVCCGVGDWL